MWLSSCARPNKKPAGQRRSFFDGTHTQFSMGHPLKFADPGLALGLVQCPNSGTRREYIPVDTLFRFKLSCAPH